jgi:O-acetyl-ADP-ribose deacetylase (regulator of RNase III)
MTTKIREIKGNILSLKHGIIVHGCNSKGVMGSGMADSIRKMYPGAYRVYRDEFEQRGLFLGGVTYYHVPSIEDDNQLVIANAITQENYGRNKNIVYVDYPAISTSFEKIAVKAKALNLPVHFPLIGCGLANGVWEKVAPRIEEALGPDIEKTLWIYQP